MCPGQIRCQPDDTVRRLRCREGRSRQRSVNVRPINNSMPGHAAHAVVGVVCRPCQDCAEGKYAPSQVTQCSDCPSGYHDQDRDPATCVAQRCSPQFCANVSLTAWALAGAATRMHSVALRERSRTLGTPAQRVRRVHPEGLTLIKLRLRNGTFLQLTSTHSKP